MECPDCGSTDIKKASVIYESGTSIGFGAALLGGDAGILGTASQTGLAKKWAPPKRVSFLIGDLLIVVGVLFSGMSIFPILSYVKQPTGPRNVYDKPWQTIGETIIAVVVTMAIAAIPATIGILWRIRCKSLFEEFKTKREMWQKTWVCMRCGTGFTVH